MASNNSLHMKALSFNYTSGPNFYILARFHHHWIKGLEDYSLSPLHDQLAIVLLKAITTLLQFKDSI